jgi:hypothetical protein
MEDGMSKAVYKSWTMKANSNVRHFSLSFTGDWSNLQGLQHMDMLVNEAMKDFPNLTRGMINVELAGNTHDPKQIGIGFDAPSYYPIPEGYTGETVYQ